MTVQYDTHANAVFSGSTVTLTLTVASNSNRILHLNAWVDDPSVTISSVAYTAGSGGTWTKTGGHVAGDRKSEIWRSTAPSTGSVTVQITLSGTPTQSAGGTLYSLYDVDQTTPHENYTSVGVASGITVTSATDNLVVGCFYGNDPGALGGVSATDVSTSPRGFYRSYRATGAASVAITWNTNASRSSSACSVKAAATGITANLTVSDASDAVASGSALALAASAAVFESADSSVASAGVAISAAFTTQEQGDALSAALAGNTANLAVQEQGDTGAAVSNLAIAGSTAVQGQGDTLAASATLALVASTAVADARDELVASAVLGIAAALAVQEQGDALDASASSQGRQTDLAAQEQGDALAASVALVLAAAAPLQDAHDALTGVAAFALAANLAAQEQGDALAAVLNSGAERTASAAVIEAGDILVSAGTVSQPAAAAGGARPSSQVKRSRPRRSTPAVAPEIAPLFPIRAYVILREEDDVCVAHAVVTGLSAAQQRRRRAAALLLLAS